MPDPSGQDGPTSAETPDRGSGNPFLPWLGWTALWVVATGVLGWIDSSNASSRTLLIPLVVAFVVGLGSRRWSFLFAPVVAGLALWVYAFVGSIRDPSSGFAADGGYQIAELVIVAVAVGSVVAAAAGVGLGLAVFPRPRARLAVDSGERGDPQARPNESGRAGIAPAPEHDTAPTSALPPEWLQPLPQNPAGPFGPETRRPT